MKRGDDTNLYFGASALFVILAGLSYGFYLPYGRTKDFDIVSQGVRDGVIADPIYAHEAMIGTGLFALMAVLALVFALDTLSNRRVNEALAGR